MLIRIILQASEDRISQGIMWRTLDGEVMQHTQKCICKTLVYVSLEWIHILKSYGSILSNPAYFISTCV